MEDTFERVLAEKKEKVWSVIEKYLKGPTLPKAFRIPEKYLKDEDFFWKVVKEYPERKGKYVRPTLLLLTAEAMGAAEEESLITAAAMQLSEDWLLVHDDFEDDSEFRRGKPTLHRMYGDKLAVNAGDSLHAIMWRAILDNKSLLGEEKANSIEEEFYRILMRTTLGQGTEIDWAQRGKVNFDDKDWFFIADGKTSYYTIAGPMRLGATIAGASLKQLEILAEFGKILGRCYQIVDDILDLTSDFAGLKKKIAYNDVYEGKRTLILGHLLRKTGFRKKRKILEILSKKRESKSQPEVEWMVQQMHDSGSIIYAKILAEKLAKSARKIFEEELTFLAKEPARHYLDLGISFMLNRSY